MEWVAPSSGTPAFVGCVITSASNLTVANNTTTFVEYTSEIIDTDAFHDNSTNPERITIPVGKAGKYLVTFAGPWASNATGYRSAVLFKNGGVTTPPTANDVAGSASSEQFVQFTTIAEYAEGDYLRVRVYQNSSGNLSFGRSQSYFSVQFLGA